MNQKGSINIAVVIVVLVAVAISGYFVFVLKLRLGITPTPSASLTSDETANWKTYSNTQLGFFFQYPGGFEIGENLPYSVNLSPVDSEEPSLQIEVKGQSLDDLTKNALDRMKNRPSNTQLFNKEISVDGRSAAEIGYTGELDVSGIYREIYINEGSQTVVITSVNFSDFILDKILSTFKFVESSQIDTSSWKTYANTKYGFEIKYPSEFETVNSSAISDSVFFHLVSEEYNTAILTINAVNVGAESVFDLGANVPTKDIIIFAGKKAKQYSCPQYVACPNQTAYEKAVRFVELPTQWGKNNEIDIEVSKGSESKSNVLDQMLSTFKFTK